VVEWGRPLAPEFNLPTCPGTVQVGVVLQATPLQVGSAGFLRVDVLSSDVLSRRRPIVPLLENKKRPVAPVQAAHKHWTAAMPTS
jgi:hypothetical protein